MLQIINLKIIGTYSTDRSAGFNNHLPKLSYSTDPNFAGVSNKYCLLKVRKTTKTRNRYNQLPHLPQNTKWESSRITTNTINKRQEPSPTPFFHCNLIKKAILSNHISSQCNYGVSSIIILLTSFINSQLR